MLKRRWGFAIRISIAGPDSPCSSSSSFASFTMLNAVSNPDSDALIRLANFFGVSIDYLVCRIPIDYSDTKGRDALIEKIKKDLDRLK